MDISLLIGRGGEPIAFQAGIASTADQCGLYGVWYGQHMRYDASVLAILASNGTQNVQLGAGVIPAYPRHPLALASQALTTDMATGHRFRLGVGPSHRQTIEGIYGLDYLSPARYVAEYLTVLSDLLRTQKTEFEGEYFRVNATLDIPEARNDIPIFTGSLGPRALEVSGRLADGNLTYLAGPRTVEQHVVPRIAAGAAQVGRPCPRVAAAVPVLVTDDAASARDALANYMSFSTSIDVYKAVMEREEISSPADLAIVGTRQQVIDGIGRFRDAGVDEFAAAILGTEAEKVRTCEVLGEAAKVFA